MLGMHKWTELTTLQVCEISVVILAVFSVVTLIFALSAAIAATRLQRRCRQCRKIGSETIGDSELCVNPNSTVTNMTATQHKQTSRRSSAARADDPYLHRNIF